MPNAFVQITPTLAQLCSTHVLLTPNERLAREYHRGFDLYQQNQGHTAWVTLRCTSLARHLKSRLAFSQTYLDDDVSLLSEHELLSLVAATAPRSTNDLTAPFLRAWQDVHRYDIALDAPELKGTRGEVFRSWFKRTHQHLPQNSVLGERLGDHLVAQRCLPDAPLILIDFDQITHSERRYLEFVAQHKALLCYDSITDTLFAFEDLARPIPQNLSGRTVSVVAVENLTEEVAAAAAWARQTKLDDPSATIGIVVPQLAQHYDKIQRQVAAVLDPQNGSKSTTFDIAAGTSLREQPVWQHVEMLLNAVISHFTAVTCRDLSHSPFFDLDFLKDVAANWPQPLPAHVSLSELTPWLSSTALSEVIARLPAKQTFAEWVDYIQQVLRIAGWPNLSDLASVQYQAVQNIVDTLEGFRGNQQARQITLSQAFNLVNNCLGNTVFAPARPPSDILIMGMLETTGLQFSHLWVCGMDENSFPSSNKANPFLPRRLLKRHGVPRATQADELEFANRMLARWSHSAPSICVSYTHTQEDMLQQLSPLLAQGVNTVEVQTDPVTHPYWVAGVQVLENFVDINGHPHPGGVVNGGTALLYDLAQCPFRAYAKYRLGLSAPVQASDFPNALIRGNLLHDTLFELVRNHSSQTLLSQLSEADIQSYSAQTLAKFPLKFPAEFVAEEIIRITKLIQQWLHIEAAREPFEVLYLEERFNLTLENLTLRIRLDRVDQIEQQWVVIDYKTGKVSLAGVTKSPTVDPQLPAYSLVDERIQGVYFGEVRPQARLVGVADPSAQLAGSTVTPTPHSWSQQRQLWREELEALAQAFAQGYAAVEPQPGACTYCHLRDVCRIDDTSQAKT